MSMNLSNKACSFINHTGAYGSLSNKAIIIGEKTFAEILPFLANERIRADLELPEPGERTPEIIGALEFAKVINVDSDYITKVYYKYLKSFLS